MLAGLEICTTLWVIKISVWNMALGGNSARDRPTYSSQHRNRGQRCNPTASRGLILALPAEPKRDFGK